MPVSFVLVFCVICMCIGRWSEFNFVVVFHVLLIAMFGGAIVMSGDVFCCCMLSGCLVCVLVFSVMWLLFSSAFAIVSPRVSLCVECHISECALKSPKSMVFLWFGAVVVCCVIRCSVSVSCCCSIVDSDMRGGMYVLISVSVFFLPKCMSRCWCSMCL